MEKGRVEKEEAGEVTGRYLHTVSAVDADKGGVGSLHTFGNQPTPEIPSLLQHLQHGKHLAA